jgi:phosphoglycerate dehydrogenase-like enzyme
MTNTQLAGTRADGTGLKIGVCLSRGADIVIQTCAAVEGVDVLKFADAASLQDRIGELDAIVIQNAVYSATFAKRAAESGRLRWIQSAASGIDAFESHGLPAGVMLTNAGDSWAPCVADHAMALLLGLMRGIPRAEWLRQERRWDQQGFGGALIGLRGRRLLVVGLGSIGAGIARRAEAFGMRVEAVTRSPQKALQRRQDVYPLERLAERLGLADAVVLSLPLTAQSVHLMNRETLRAMKRTAVLVNVSRGGVIDETALLETLMDGHLAGVGLDVAETEPLPPQSPLWTAPRTCITPHVAAFDDGPGFELLAELCHDNIVRLKGGRPLRNQIGAMPGGRTP